MYTNQNYNNKKGSLNRGGAHALWKFANELALRSFQWRATDHLWTLNLIPVWSTSRSEQMCQQPKWWGKIMSLRTKLRADGEQLPWWCDSHTWWCWCCVCVCERQTEIRRVLSSCCTDRVQGDQRDFTRPHLSEQTVPPHLCLRIKTHLIPTRFALLWKNTN